MTTRTSNGFLGRASQHLLVPAAALSSPASFLLSLSFTFVVFNNYALLRTCSDGPPHTCYTLS